MATHLAFYKGKGGLSNLGVRTACSIKHRAKVQYSHIEILKSYPQNEPVLNSRGQLCVSASKQDNHQVRAKWIDFKPTHWDFFTLFGQDNIFPKAAQVVGKPYDYAGMLLCLTPLARSKPDTWFCSQLVAHLLNYKDAESYDPHKLSTTLKSHGAYVGEVMS